MKTHFLIVLFFFSFHLLQAQVKIVVLGSSTAFGDGASIKDSAWVNRYKKYVQDINPLNEVINLAKGGYTTYHILPSGSYTTGKPNPDVNRNITKALSYEPDAIIINLPSNDAAALYPVQDQLKNYDLVLSKADSAGVPVWVATTQPRNMAFPNQINLVVMRDSTISRFGEMAIDFWTELADSATVGSINDDYDSGDGVHLNDAGHRLLFERVIEKNIVNVDSSSLNIFEPMIGGMKIQVYPNPADEQIRFKIPEGFNSQKVLITIYNIEGRTVMNSFLYTDQRSHEINVSALELGIYMIQFRWEDKLYTGKFIKVNS
jgi:lysophospholipase L1-like esterase